MRTVSTTGNEVSLEHGAGSGREAEIGVGGESTNASIVKSERERLLPTVRFEPAT